MKKFIPCLLSLLPLCGYSKWQPDILGDGYEMKYIEHGRDYEGKVRSTVIRKLSPQGGDKAVLYIHGYNDYFFQKEMGDRFVGSGYNFYAVDLRKYGRSLLPGQTRFEVRDLSEYFGDIVSAMTQMRRDGIRDVILMGHSTGGLVASYYMDRSKDTMVKALVLNSPFLDWNLSGFLRNVVIPAVGTIGAVLPGIRISNGHSSAYGESLLSSCHGEWTYNTEWKTMQPLKVSTAWVRSIAKAQHHLQRRSRIKVPVLLMHSDNTVQGDTYTDAFRHGDAVLNIESISKYGRRLGKKVEDVAIKGGLHDLVLSEKSVRNTVYRTIFSFLRRLS